MLKQGQVAYLAGLAKIAMTEEEVVRMEKDMESIMELMDSITEVELSQAHEREESVTIDSLREDIPRQWISPEKLSRDEEGFVIPKIME